MSSRIAIVSAPPGSARCWTAGPSSGPDELELDVRAGRRTAVAPARAAPAPAELHLVEQPRPEAFLGGRGAVEQDVAVAGGRLGLGDAGRDVGDVARGPRRWLGRRGAGQHEDRDAVVVVARPAARELERPPAGDDRAGGHHLVEHRRARLVGRPVGRRVDAAVGQPAVQQLAADPEPVFLAVVRPGDEPVHRHRHVQHDLAHRATLQDRGRAVESQKRGWRRIVDGWSTRPASATTSCDWSTAACRCRSSRRPSATRSCGPCPPRAPAS